MSLVEPAQDPLSRFDIHALIEGCARLRPDQVAVTDSAGTQVTFGDLDIGTRGLAGALGSLGLMAGECVLLIGTPRVATLLGLFASLRAGLNVAIAPPHLGAAEIAAFAARARAVAALVGGAYGEMQPIELAMQAAATCESLRLLCSLEGSEDGAVDLNDFIRPDAQVSIEDASQARILTVVPGGALRHQQRTLIASALDAAARLRINAGERIVTTIAPASFAGVVAGPLLALITGASLEFHGPFASDELLLTLQDAPAHLVAPRLLGPALQDAGLLSEAYAHALLLMHRASQLDETVLPMEGVGIPVYDLTGFGETCLIVEPRDADGEVLPPAGRPHMIELEGRSIVAVRRVSGAFASRLDGEAVTTL